MKVPSSEFKVCSMLSNAMLSDTSRHCTCTCTSPIKRLASIDNLDPRLVNRIRHLIDEADI